MKRLLVAILCITMMTSNLVPVWGEAREAYEGLEGADFYNDDELEKAEKSAESEQTESNAAEEGESKQAESNAAEESESKQTESNAVKESESKQTESNADKETESKQAENNATEESESKQDIEKAEEQQTESIPEYADNCDDSEAAKHDNHDDHKMQQVFNDDKSKYSIAISDARISFGKQTVGYAIDSQAVYITNTGSSTVNLIWKDVDPDCAFVVDTTKAQNIGPGAMVPVYVSVATNKGVGAYNGVILFADSTDTAYASGVKLEVSVTIQEEKARVKTISLTPGDVTASPNSSVNFSATVTGDGEIDKTVKYSVAGNKSTDTYIDERGRLNIASNETAQALTVKAVSVQDSSQYKEARVNIKNNTYSVNIYASPYYGGDVIGGGAYAQGSTVVLKAYAANGWYLNGWEVNGERILAGSVYTIENINKNYEISAIFDRDSVRIKAQPNNKHMGTIEGDGYAEFGSNVVLKAKAKSGYRFACWMEGKKKLGTDTKLKLKNVDEDRDITAVFTKNECVVSVASCDTTMGSVSGGKKVEYGKDVTIKAKANKGYRFVRWVCNDQEIATNAEYKLKELKDDITVVAIFEKENAQDVQRYKLISGTTDSNGVISPGGEIMIEKGKSINYTVTPKSGYKIAAIAIDGKPVSVSSSITISDIKSNHTIVAAFLPIETAAKVDAPTAMQTQKEAAGSDINNQVKLAPAKKYEEHIVKSDIDTEKYVGAAKDSMDNSLDEEEGVLQECNITEEEAMGRLGDDSFKYELVREAVASENLEVNIDNSMRKNKFIMSYDENALDNPETENFAKILCGVFTEDEVMALISGREQVHVDVSIASAQEDYVPLGQLSKIKEGAPANMKPGQYFYASFMKNVDGVTSEVTEFNIPLMVTVDIPDRIYKAGGSYKIARLHTNSDGSEELSILDDTDADPKTITFKTDRFSTYAILCDADIEVNANEPLARPVIDRKNTDNIVVAVGVLCVILTVIAGVVITRINVRRRKRR